MQLFRIAAVLSLAPLAAAQTFDCVVQSPQSGLDVIIDVDTTLPGTLIGAYDAETNPTGTRTKPGLFGTFGSTENVECPITIGGGIDEHRLISRPAGVFALSIDTEALTASVEGYNVNFIADGEEVIPVTVRFSTEAFRTRSPTSTYIAGTVNLPIGDATISVFRAVQSGGSLGTLTESGPDSYTFVVPIEVLYEFNATILDNPVEIPGGTPAPFVLSGTVAIQPDGSAVITSSLTIEIGDSQEVNEPLPPQAFPLPTILPPGLTANVILNLTLQSLTVGVNGTQTLRAVGTRREERCIADFNQDGGIDGADVEAFYDAWESGSDAADVNADGGIDGADVETFFAEWESGTC